MKSYTDLEQSKMLAEILPLESADMEYMFLKRDSSKVSNVPFVKDDGEPEWPDDSSYDFIPCWSLAALLKVIPCSYGVYRHPYDDGLTLSLQISNRMEVTADNEVDACYEMILELHKLNLLRL